MDKKIDIKNARFKLVDSTLKGCKEVEVVFNYNGEDHKYFIFVDEGKNTNYINEAKKQFNQDINSGKVLKSIKPSVVNHRPWLIACASVLGVAAITFAALFTWKALTNGGVTPEPQPEPVPPGPTPPEPEPSNYVTLTLDAGEGNTVEGTKNQIFKYYVEKGTTVADTFKTLHYKGAVSEDNDFLYWTINNQPIDMGYVINEDINLVPAYKPVQTDCLTITARQDKLSINFTIGINLQVSFNHEDWDDVTSDAIVLEHAGDQVYIKRAKETALEYSIINSSKKLHSISGPIEALVNDKTSGLADNAFQYCFSDDTNLVSASNLSFRNITTLSEYCYSAMFSSCSSLVTAPAVLPATTLAANCYYDMFSGCKSLTTAPALPAEITSNDSNCYNSMFVECSSLIAAPELPSQTLANYCYSRMFYNCTSLVTAPAALPAQTLAQGCYSEMFFGCFSLITAPELLAQELEKYCCSSMFYGCPSLVTAPELLSQTLAEGCYSEMFYNCSSLKVNENGTGTKIFTCPSPIPSGAVDNMFNYTAGSFTTGTPTVGNTYYWYA